MQFTRAIKNVPFAALFWDGRCEDDLAREWGVSRQAVSKRKQKILLELQQQVGMP